MGEWTDVGSIHDIKPGDFRLVDVDDTPILVFNCHGSFYAIEDVCTHDGGTLSDGEAQGCEIICPRHGARFDVTTGAVTAPPAYEPVHTFPVRVMDERIQIKNDRWD